MLWQHTLCCNTEECQNMEKPQECGGDVFHDTVPIFWLLMAIFSINRDISGAGLGMVGREIREQEKHLQLYC